MFAMRFALHVRPTRLVPKPSHGRSRHFEARPGPAVRLDPESGLSAGDFGLLSAAGAHGTDEAPTARHGQTASAAHGAVHHGHAFLSAADPLAGEICGPQPRGGLEGRGGATELCSITLN